MPHASGLTNVSAERLDELGRGTRKDLATLVNYANWPRKPRGNERNRDEQSPLRLVHNGRKRQNAHANADFNRLLDRLDVVKFGDDVDANAVLTQRPVDLAPYRKIAIISDKIEPLKLVYLEASLSGERMIGRYDDHHLF